MLVGTVALGMLIPLGIIVGDTILGATTHSGGILHAGSDPTRSVEPGRRPGAARPRSSATLEQVGIATLLSVPLGIATAVFLNEIGGALARPVRMIVDAMSAIPSIVAGLFVYAAFILRVAPAADRVRRRARAWPC